MAQITQQLCDGCGALLSGKSGITHVRKPCIEINGQIVFETVDKDTNWRDHVFVTRTPNERLAFCVGDDEEHPKLDCLGMYVERALDRFKQYKEKQLREEASGEWEERQQKGFVTRKNHTLTMDTNPKIYLGDSVYALYDGRGIWLTTENGAPDDPSNKIFLDAGTLNALNLFASQTIYEKEK